ncbi:pyruvate dehydrogenase (acetyl-transferring) E1 component subunit alpha [Candidatus Woesearchaeota archaeon]|nr:pyruvate dehydrogenase (acetyl-transferring) E1 component subunit alpha [Candidatus Woesearchaeota archaeon]
MVKKVIQKFKVEFLQVLNEKGNTDKKLMPKLTKEKIKQLYESMILVRTFDDKAFSLQRQGRIGTYLQVKGQEAIQVAAAILLEDKDWLFPMYRNSAALIIRKHPMEMILQYWSGDERGLKSSDNVNNFPIAIPVGSHIPHAVGAAWAAKLKGDKTISLAFFGDGATSKADFHTGMNFAGVFQVPVVLICENNQYAISVPRKTQTHSETIAQKAIAYGIRGIQVDGNDIFAVYKSAKDAIDLARKGKGPTLIECLTYRIGDHSTSDDASRYRSKKEVAFWIKKDPVERLEKYMAKKKILNPSYKEQVLKEAKEKVEHAVNQFEKIPEQNKSEICNYTFAELNQQLQEQCAPLKK